ncbi:hypothetical protein SmJEL517_g06167 [Synchytrium microbalum]|uniref:Carotenoid oxygenase n=1 Tax=Synchytrium microbalum TaxID=1806994 RepID=A0A507BWU2_9FUNG|nr:uncharacterized protein SmJEL517_g06167 [Synchytrium microbalum]TPX30226.1 hypothetical protein SmJEL517_g06167 [Synchytrium microbalum]
MTTPTGFRSRAEYEQAARRGWENSKESQEYWIPELDIFTGTFFRNGPGLADVYGFKLKHPIDGDGMLAALTFVDGRVHFRSKFVNTWQHQQEQYHRQFLFPGQMGSRNDSVVGNSLKLLSSTVTGKKPQIGPFRDPSNTNVFYFGGKLLSAYETMLPHSIDPYTLETLGPDDLNGTLPLRSFAAHYRYDAKKDVIVTLSLKPEMPGVAGMKARPPAVQLNEYDRDWKCVSSRMLNIPGLNYAHDFVLTPNFYIIHMTPFVKMTAAQFYAIAVGAGGPGDYMKHYPELPSRYVCIPRDATGKIQQLDTGRFHIYHFGNAMEEPSNAKSSSEVKKITFNAVCLGEKFTMEYEKGLWLANATVQPGLLHEFSLDMKTNTCTQSVGDSSNSEFPSVHPYRHGQGGRFVYMMSSTDPANPLPFVDLVKYDSEKKARQVWHAHGVIGEPYFCPRGGEKSATEGDEDDGFVIVQVYVVKEHRTDFCLLDAKHVDKGPIAVIRLRHHIPYGFHGTFCPETFVAAPPAMKSSHL